jgi:colanic acid/amylovoran biosynthesis glycosyltransferase
MRIAFLVRSFPVISETFIINQVIGLLDQGHEVHIYSVNNKPMTHLDKNHDLIKKYQLLDRTFYSQKIPKNYLARLLKAIKLFLQHQSQLSLQFLQVFNIFKYGKIAYSLRLFYNAISHLDKNSYDIIHCQFGYLGLAGLALKDVGILQGKLIVHFRGSDISQYIQKHGYKVYQKVFAEADYFLTNCEFFRNRLIKLGCNPNKIEVLGSGIDCNQFSFSPRSFPENGKIKIMTVGRFVEKKGIEYGIKAISHLVSSGFNQIEYNIVGDGLLRDKIEHLIDRLYLKDYVKLQGQKTQQEIIQIMDKSHIFIAPSVTSEAGDQDAPVNTLKEAMAMGLPVISTWHGGIPELVENNISGFLVPERDAQAIAEKLKYLMTHPQIWRSMTDAGRKKVKEKYDINRLNNQLIKTYENLLNSDLSPKKRLI